MTAVVSTILSGDTALDPSVTIFSLEVRKELDRIPEARLVLGDGSAAMREFALSNADFFAPGKRIQILLRRGSDADHPVFAGVVVRQAVAAHADGTRLRIDLRDAALMLSRRRRSAIYRDQQDDAIARELISAAGLTAGTIDPTSVQHRELVQYNTSDWDFLLSRADVNGQVVIVDNGTLSLRSMAADVEAGARYEFGLDTIYELELELDGSTQWGSITSQAWDPAQQATSQPVSGTQLNLTAGNLDVAALAPELGGESYTLLHPAPLSEAELLPWATARLARSRLSLIRGRVCVEGRADLKPFDRIELGGVGGRFNGKLFIAGVIHRFDQDGWRTELQIGLRPEWFARTPEIADVPASGLLPPVAGLQIGLVDGFQEDPEGERRIKVRLPALTPEHGSVWARVARPDAGAGRGFIFWPEPGDEVVVGFLADDPRQAVILGALHGSVHAPPAAGEGPSEDNFRRALVSKVGTTLAFDDEKPAITIKTPNNNTIVIDDDAQSIKLSDQHGNQITMNADGIKLAGAGNFAIDVSGDVVIKGSTVDIQ